MTSAKASPLRQERSEAASSAERASQPARRPRDAATLVIVDSTSPAPRILMGRRRPDQVFLPNTFVFPGGRVEAADRAIARHHTLAPIDSECLKIAMRGRASNTRAAALALAAIRETYEETGIVVGETARDERGDHPGGWQAFRAEGFQPRLERLAFFARAITPPGRPRRYDTRFFLVDASEIAHRAAHSDGELLDIDWFTLDQARALKVPSITRHVLDDVATLLARESHERVGSEIPFYVHRYGRFERQILPRVHPAMDPT
ncbi:NUDIX hydrolase [Hyphomicrobium sp. LHD-15]|uniref:NUDIX hydrolase n=1 Tax=Hyphomicrobium sp. LHD-15 TaxID=3072142 RepID=UPI00280F3DD1|nr:NUDIX hydrolase [Hyphomicrobium sp. LHD-15]MDQ8699705.1 NUDIX hydrolase [Hyphomicrobium sp. LHD-15]